MQTLGEYPCDPYRIPRIKARYPAGAGLFRSGRYTSWRGLLMPGTNPPLGGIYLTEHNLEVFFFSVFFAQMTDKLWW